MSIITQEIPAAMWLLRQARPRRLRSMHQFAEDEIVIPTGPFQGRKFRCSRQPFTKAWFDLIDSGNWNRFVATGPTQSGKSLSCFVIPMMYHLFEIGETVICGLPDMDMAGDKWREDILPVIERSRYRDIVPTQGGGSRGGRVESLTFTNGATLKFMSGGGSDKSRAGFTSRVVVITETDGMDTPGGTSRESDKITQLEARTRAYGSRKRVYLECTVSTETGRTWQEFTNGTNTRLVIRCPACHGWVSPEREQLTGWQDAETEMGARKAGAFVCPACGVLWSSEERANANANMVTVHKGQTIDEAGVVTGALPETNTLGFRWSAVNNLFLSAGDIAADEWKGAHAADEENAQRALRQFVWCLPVTPTKIDAMHLEVHALASRCAPLAKGIAPAKPLCITVGVDVQKYLLYWIAVAWMPGATGHVLDYGRQEVATDSLGLERALLVALKELRDIMNGGWPEGTVDGKHIVPQQVWIDAGFMAPVVYEFCRDAGERFRPLVGRGAGQQRTQWAQRTTQTGSVVKMVGEGYHATWLPTEQLHLMQADADYWKTWVHQRMSTPLGQVGAMSLYTAQPKEHLALAKHLTAEVKTEEFVAGKGVVTKWERIRRQNHWLDGLYIASAAGHGCGVRLVDENAAVDQPAQPPVPPAREGPKEISRIDSDRFREQFQRYQR